MADYQLQASKFHKESTFTSDGIIAPIDGHKLYGERAVNVVVMGATSTNSIIVKAKLQGADEWVELAQLSGSGPFPFVHIANYDYIRFEVLRYGPISGVTPKLIATGYFAPADGDVRIVDRIETQTEQINVLNCNVLKLVQGMEKISFLLSKITDTYGEME
jgi:hypothetical protein